MKKYGLEWMEVPKSAPLKTMVNLKEKIKREREEARLKVETERLDDEAAAAADAATTGNPLLLGTSAQVKRKWNDDVVFRNQARDGGAAAQPTKKRFVNDTVRNDFHKRFLGKYIR